MHQPKHKLLAVTKPLHVISCKYYLQSQNPCTSSQGSTICSYKTPARHLKEVLFAVTKPMHVISRKYYLQSQNPCTSSQGSTICSYKTPARHPKHKLFAVSKRVWDPCPNPYKNDTYFVYKTAIEFTLFPRLAEYMVCHPPATDS